MEINEPLDVRGVEDAYVLGLGKSPEQIGLDPLVVLSDKEEVKMELDWIEL